MNIRNADTTTDTTGTASSVGAIAHLLGATASLLGATANLIGASSPPKEAGIIRCRECKHYKTEFCAIDIWTDEVKIYKARPDDFCSRAERRTDG